MSRHCKTDILLRGRQIQSVYKRTFIITSCHTVLSVSHHIIASCYNCYKITWQKAGCVCPCPSLENIVMEDVMLVMFCSTHIGGLGQLHAQIWMTAKMQNFKCQSSLRKIRNIQSESVSKTAWCFIPQNATADLEVQKFSTWIPYFLVCSCVDKIYKRGDVLSHSLYVRCPHFPTHVWEWELDRKVWHAAELWASQGPENVL